MRTAFKIGFCGQDLILDASGAIYWPSEKLLIIADLHFEKGNAFARQGHLIPPLDTKITIEKLTKLFAHYQPEAILSLGDSFHDTRIFNFIAPDIRQYLTSLSQQFHWIWISGNHDPFLPDNLNGEIVTKKKIQTLTFCHEPQKNGEKGQVSGHLHPAKRIKRYGASIRGFCFATDFSRLILPALGAYAGGLDLEHRAFNGLFDVKKLVAFLLHQGEIFPIKPQ
ncbi:ligase-associated DNA damage response endonuclease PdeM [Bartonella sp. HY038]|uniref:ligase-associated DNA damage response endonuclease PdeM n=1 Tax=Bartonella sp. HY038 TaxID=2759660 RepID=UPI0015FCC728|nr:ligase-associated DNA damage response endonuclease PdeM [Bartonella sp. HY038]